MQKMMMKSKEEWAKWFLFFLTSSFIGWIYEVCVYHFEFGYGYINRGFLFGPYLPVYGVGGLLIIVTMLKLKQRRILFCGTFVTPVICFVLAVVVSTATELLTSYLMEFAIGEWLWDYTEDIPNFQGRIALKSSLRFGIMGVVGFYGVYPLFSKCVESVKQHWPKIYKAISIALLVLFLADVVARLFLGSNYVGP